MNTLPLRFKIDVAITDDVVDVEFDVVFDDEHDSGDGDGDNDNGDDDDAVMVFSITDEPAKSKVSILHLSLFEGDAWGEGDGVKDIHSTLLPK